MFRDMAHNRTVDVGLVMLNAAIGVELVEVEWRAVLFEPKGNIQFALQPRHAVETIREMLADHVPVATSALRATDAVVIPKTEPIHHRNLDARALDDGEAVRFHKPRLYVIA